MKTAIVRMPGGPEALEIVECDVPKPGPKEVLIRTAVMAISGPDVLIRQGRYKWAPPLPLSPGNELVGFVEAIGAEVTDIDVGVAVLLSSRELPARGGCYAEFRAVPATAVHVLPNGIDLEQAVVIPTYLVAHAMLNSLAFATNARSIFVNGVAGIVGSALTEFAKQKGLQVIGTVSSEQKARFAKSKGVDELIYYRSESVLERVMAITHGRGVDAAFDHVIGNGFIDCIRMLADFGTTVAYNVHTPAPDEDVFEELRRLSVKSPALRVFNIHTYDHDLPRLRALTREVIRMVAAGRVKPSIGARLPLARVADAHRMFEAGTALGKIVLVP